MTKNEELVIERTVRSLRRFAQILVVDSNSTDQTSTLATKAGADVIQFEWNGRYPKKKQWSMDHTFIKFDWVFFVDADEYPSAALVEDIALKCRESTSVAAWEAALEYSFDGKVLRHGHTVRKTVLLDRSRCRFPEVHDLEVANMWEVEGHYQPRVSGRIGALRGFLQHEDRDPLYDYFGRHNRYSDWEAYLRTNRDMQMSVRATRSRAGRLFDAVPFKPIFFFLYSYILRQGFLDGRPGFNYAVALSFYYWQISLKARELIRVREEGGLR
ncbi:glycosyltransferase family 2 protein [Actinomycetospora termitidis]|uniref:Glycosyltransferase family 2 protein n=1 Tax=Actinomycetospora termitidis TaxID=3053470 RepID=A0ABT7ME84_9PSEU|nr:glycosyltransferase family 2 protein [Actinomycetospora sp. Odt1-22]MDL5158976.1 glycosyltransferase family 2 protein [Actinomycetospora sp. Odt1-22]